MASVPGHLAGTTSGVSNTFRQVGAVFGVAVSGAAVLRHVRTSLAPDVSALPLSQSAKNDLLAALGRGDTAKVQALPAAVRAALAPRMSTEFVSGMHWAFLFSAIGALLSGLIALRFFKRPDPAPAAGAAAEPVPVSNASVE